MRPAAGSPNGCTCDCSPSPPGQPAPAAPSTGETAPWTWSTFLTEALCSILSRNVTQLSRKIIQCPAFGTSGRLEPLPPTTDPIRSIFTSNPGGVVIHSELSTTAIADVVRRPPVTGPWRVLLKPATHSTCVARAISVHRSAHCSSPKEASNSTPARGRPVKRYRRTIIELDAERARKDVVLDSRRTAGS